MGCAYPGDTRPPEETTIRHRESELRFSNRNSREVDLIIRKYSGGTSVNQSQFASIAARLDLNTQIRRLAPQPVNFFEALKEQGGLLPRRTLLVLGILLSPSHPVHKARLLFESYDDHNCKSLSCAALAALLTLTMEISLIVLPSLAYPTHYSTLLAHHRARAVRGLIASFPFTDDSIELGAFIAYCHLTTPSALRAFALSL